MELRRKLPFAVILWAVLTPAIAFALPTIVPCSGAVASGGLQPCTICSIATLAQNLVNVGIFVAVFLSAVLFAWAGFKYLTAGGDSEAASKARAVFTNVAIGLIIILAGWLVVNTIMQVLTNNSGWNSICTTAAVELPHLG